MSVELPRLEIPLDVIIWASSTLLAWPAGQTLADTADKISQKIEPHDSRLQAMNELSQELPLILTGATTLYFFVTNPSPEVQIFSVPLATFLVSYSSAALKSVLGKWRRNEYNLSTDDDM